MRQKGVGVSRRTEKKEESRVSRNTEVYKASGIDSKRNRTTQEIDKQSEIYISCSGARQPNNRTQLIQSKK